MVTAIASASSNTAASSGNSKGTQDYKVKLGDTLGEIAARFGTDIETLARMNNISNPNRIMAGQTLEVPVGSKGYTVQRGDTLGEIATKNGTTVKALMDANPQIRNANRIYPGDVINIAGTGTASGGSTVASTTAPQAASGQSKGYINGSHQLGSLSAKYETGGRGPGVVSHGRGDHGGISYGSYQFATNMATPQKFLESEGKRWAAEFGNHRPGSEKFGEMWAKIAAREPNAFHSAQHNFIKRTHYDVQVAHIKSATDVDVNKLSQTVQDVVWSTAVQHGAKGNVIARAMKKMSISPGQPGYDKALIDAVYNERGKRNASGELAYFSSSSKAQQEGVSDRFVKERRQAQKMLANELKGTSTPSQAATAVSSSVSQKPSTSEFINPTGQGLRNDSGGQGHFHAPRGARLHKGLDILSTPGQPVRAPISGRLEISNPQNVHSGFKITSDDGKTVVKVFYVKYDASLIGKRVNAGDNVGTAQDLQMQNKYPQNVKDHVHVEVIKNGNKVDPKPFFF
jgi:LysM repeat protein